jgi:DMSO/TMAO reductase YedYZ molybdopterin-dependent catalytic subunit
MTVTNDREQERAALRMIHPAPFNAEAPPEALAGQITPTELHYVRSNFAVPPHDGKLEIGGAVQNPTTLTLDDLRAMPATERAVTLECAGNGRLEMRPLPTGEPWGDYAVSTARWTGAFLHEVLKQTHPAADGVDVRFEGADHGAYHLQPILADTNKDDLTFVRALPLAHAADPAAEILIAYEMNDEPLTPDHGAPLRLIVPHWYAVASVKWLKRIDVLTERYTGEFQTGHYMYEWPDRPHEGRQPHARTCTNHRSCARVDHQGRNAHRTRQGLVRNRTSGKGRRQPHRRRRLAPGTARATRRPVPMARLVIRLGGHRRRTARPPRQGDRRRRQYATRSPALEPARLREQRHRDHLRRRTLTRTEKRAPSTRLKHRVATSAIRPAAWPSARRTRHW